MKPDTFTHTEADAGLYERMRAEDADEVWLQRPTPDELDDEPQQGLPASPSLVASIDRVRVRS